MRFFLPCEVTPSCLALLLALSPTSSHPLLVVHSITFHLIMMVMMMKMMIMKKTKIMTRSGLRTRVVEAPQGRERPGAARWPLEEARWPLGEVRWQVNSTCNSFTGQLHIRSVKRCLAIYYRQELLLAKYKIVHLQINTPCKAFPW